MKCLAVGVDGSGVGQNALRWATDLAVRIGAQVHAINCFHDPYSEVTPENHDRLLAERERELSDEWTTIARDAGLTVTTEVRQGDPRQVLGHMTDQDHADLLVLGRAGAGGGPGFLHLGSVVEHVAHHLSIPLAVIPPAASRVVERIAVGVDGSAGSRAAVLWTADLASALGATVVAVNVEEPYVEWTMPESPRNWRRDTEHRIAKWTAPLEAADVPVRSIAHRNLRPAYGLLEAATACHSDLLVIGERGLGGFTGMRIGGVALRVLHRADLPLAIIPGE
jgi:nucleotide-binding universal stress UspA family protein